MKQAKNYEIVISDEGIPVFLIPSQATLKNPKLLYDGKEHAILCDKEKNGMILDYLPNEIKPVLKKCKWAVILEKNKQGNNVLKDYKVSIEIVSELPIHPLYSETMRSRLKTKSTPL